MLQNLPLEVVVRIFDLLNIETLKQCQLVSREWSKPAQVRIYSKINCHKPRYVSLLNALASSPSIGSLVKEIEFFGVNSIPMQNYRYLMEHTPNLQSLTDNDLKGAHYELFYQLINQGYLKKLGTLNSSALYHQPTNRENSIVTPDDYHYYALCSAIKGRLKTIKLNSSTVSPPYEGMHCFCFPEYITRQTRFPKVEQLTCISSTSMTLSDLEDVLQLCPAMDEHVLGLASLVTHADELYTIKPNVYVTKLKVELKEASENNFRYILKKFPHVRHLELKIYCHTRNGNFHLSRLSHEVVDQLATYSAQTDELTLEHGQFPSDFGERNATFLSELSRFDYIGSYGASDQTMEDCKRILMFYKNVSHFGMEDCSFDELVLQTPILSCNDIQLEGCSISGDALETLGSSFPLIRELYLIETDIESDDGYCSISIPGVSLDSLTFENSGVEADFLLLDCGGSYYSLDDDTSGLKRISSREYDHRVFNRSTFMLNVSCACLYSIEISLGYASCQHEFVNDTDNDTDDELTD
ncbi:hypothetical protein A0J61_03883 [Choanephora cucurbitarum]|uniref:F-box domain-containing protein n=1 Tax=Choanephora cucurbitarum TaxID=101091 RepID=A0A1C7NG51_9FUNG|nr:hypothetical protein A0J61_03883 [Choanephora cucurbitarum]